LKTCEAIMTYLLRWLGTLALVLTIVVGVIGSATAQTKTAPDYDAWKTVATRASDAVEASRASDAALGDLRSQLVSWREQFAEARSKNQNAIVTVQSQLDILGPLPEEGKEPSDIITQRSELTARLAELQAPVRTAEVAHSEADSLISGVDNILRERQAEELLELGPSPVNPSLWAKGFSTFTRSFGNVRNEVRTAWENPAQQQAFKQNLPRVLVLLVLSIVLIGRGRKWIEDWTQNIMRRGNTSGRWLAALVVSLGQILVPFVGVIALVEAVYATELPGLRGDLILSLIPGAAFLQLISIWLGTRLFPKTPSSHPMVDLSDEGRRLGRVVTGLLGLILVLNLIITEMGQFDQWSAEAKAVIHFPLILAGCLLIWRLASLLKSHDDAELEAVQNYGHRLLDLVGRLLLFVVIAGPLLAAIGYSTAAHRLVFPTIQTLQVIGFIVVLQRVITAFYVFATGKNDEGRESLIPVLAGFVLAIATLPILALIWGARYSDLTELWAQMASGITLGETKISPRDLLTLVIVFFGGMLLTRLIQGALKTSILPKTRLDIGGQNAVVSGLGYVGITIAAVLSITAAGIDLSSIALVAGALSVGIGFGLQNVVSNFVSGIILLIERPISEGDWIEVGGHMGYVRDISVRSTRIETFDRTDVIVPNGDLVSGTVTNFTRGNTIGRVIVPVGVAYGTDPRLVEKILLEIAQAHPMALANPAPYVVFQGFGASSLDFEIRAILRDVNWVLSVRSDMNYQIAERFMEEGIEIPFAQTDIWLRNPETLRERGPSMASGPAKQPKSTPLPTPILSSSEHLDEGDMAGNTEAEGDAGDR
jgi:small-conductance mechanosensitive channel